MIGVVWGDYQDYFFGKWDGVKDYFKEGQCDCEGWEIVYGYLIFYIVFIESFICYMQEKQIKWVIDVGIIFIYLEELEFWMWGGYSEVFKFEW